MRLMQHWRREEMSREEIRRLNTCLNTHEFVLKYHKIISRLISPVPAVEQQLSIHGAEGALSAGSHFMGKASPAYAAAPCMGPQQKASTLFIYLFGRCMAWGRGASLNRKMFSSKSGPPVQC
eukprot:262393-Pelagomonas_calceolata.AAC.4